ncbi:hypothetical protein BJF79_34960 [Actinomadura sp. CNU-125]|uniref:hypothetical protein n=1 Tax=Actinomadura sp. CNU-125 TaxID=1904961 RepID=UPI00095BDC71|nr:hypothetical protein [Actinomadura sp. CNU-125]OLT33308.1 hypothetical protein BJF79_34960 [Actinomadura sp. CNU-125]
MAAETPTGHGTPGRDEQARPGEQHRSRGAENGLRALTPPFVAAGPSGVSISTRLKRLTPEGEVSIRLPTPLTDLANAAHGRYVLSARATFPHRGTEWADRVEADRAVAYRIHHVVDRGRWYLTASWQRRPAPALPLEAARAGGIVGVDTDKTREKHGRRKRFRQLISGLPTGRLQARLTSMAAEQGLAIVVVDPAYTSRWGAQHWQQPMRTPDREVSRHDAASIAVGRRALGHPIRRRTAPPPAHRSDEQGHRTVQTEPETPGREETRHPGPEPAHDARPRTGQRTRATSASNTVRDARRTRTRVQDPLLNTVWER